MQSFFRESTYFDSVITINGFRHVCSTQYDRFLPDYDEFKMRVIVSINQPE